MYDITQFDPTRPLQVGVVYGVMSPPPGTHNIPYVFDGERLVPHDGHATEPMPHAGHAMLEAERRAVEEAGREEREAREEQERLAREAVRLGLVDDEE